LFVSTAEAIFSLELLTLEVLLISFLFFFIFLLDILNGILFFYRLGDFLFLLRGLRCRLFFFFRLLRLN
jgi:hypothetical protein